MRERERDTGKEAAFVRRVAEAFAPEPLDAAGRARFDARLAERIAREQRRRLGPLPAGWLAPLASAAAVMALAWWGFAGGVGPRPDGERQLPAEQRAGWELAAWEWDLLLGSEAAASAGNEDELPAEYTAIAHAFLSR